MQNEIEGMILAEYNVLVRMDPVATTTSGGLSLPEEYVARKEAEQDRGILAKVSPLAFNYAEWPEGIKPQAGDRVLLAMFDGRLIDFDGVKYRAVKDKSVVAWWPKPAELAAAA